MVRGEECLLCLEGEVAGWGEEEVVGVLLSFWVFLGFGVGLLG